MQYELEILHICTHSEAPKFGFVGLTVPWVNYIWNGATGGKYSYIHKQM